MPPTNMSKEILERMIWGHGASQETAPRRLSDGNESDIKEISPSPGYRRHSYPSRMFANTTREPSHSQRPLSSPHQSSTPRRRPRGSDVGKSLHKAAEATRLSPLSSPAQPHGRMRSLGSAKHIIPALNTSVPFEHSPVDGTPRRVHLARKSVLPIAGHPTKYSLKRKAETPIESGGSGAPAQLSNRTLTCGLAYVSSLSRSVTHRPLEQDASTSRSRSLGPTISDRDYPQVARKSAFRMVVNTIRRQTSKERVSQPNSQRIKAARKTSAHSVLDPLRLSSDASENDEDSGDEDSTSASLSSFSAGEFVSEDLSAEAWKAGKEQELRSVEYQPSYRDESNLEPQDARTSVSPIRHDPKFADIERITPAAQSRVDIFQVRSASPGRGPSLDSLPSPVHSACPSLESATSAPSIKATHQHVLPRSSPHPESREDEPHRLLVAAFESLSAYPLQLHRKNRLPFLLRNVRTSFRAWCRELSIVTYEEDSVMGRRNGVPLKYEYAPSPGELHTYSTALFNCVCPLCSIFGAFRSWEALEKHVRWDHPEVMLEVIRGDDPNAVQSIIVRIKDTAACSQGTSPYIPPVKQVGSHTDESRTSRIQAVGIPEVMKVDAPGSAKRSSYVTFHPRHSPAGPGSPSASIISQKSTCSIEVFDYPPIATTPPPDATSDPNFPNVHQPPSSSVIRAGASSQSKTIRLLPGNPETRSTDLPNPHGPACPIVADPSHAVSENQPITYRPTGPHLYDHLSTLPLEIFGRRSWFVLDKEEEIFELTDVLDEDKVICALWGRWILRNRQLFIANYFSGVEAFVDEHWFIIHRAAGWGALRAWLMMLVSRRFLKNTEMVQILKMYNVLVGKKSIE